MPPSFAAGRPEGLRFGQVADAYELARPGYPAAVVHWLAGDPPRDVLDVGAGTGKLTRALVAAGHRVDAVEPDPAMAAALTAAVPSATVTVAPAEALPAAAASYDVVTVGQAFHWFEPVAALAQAARVLRPGGTLGLVWNLWDESTPALARLGAILQRQPTRAEAPPAELLAAAQLGPARSATFRHEQLLDRAGLIGAAASRSYVISRPEPARARLLAAVGQLYDEVAGPDGFVLPFMAHAFRMTRGPAPTTTARSSASAGGATTTA